jgi:hypothetical protein
MRAVEQSHAAGDVAPRAAVGEQRRRDVEAEAGQEELGASPISDWNV